MALDVISDYLAPAMAERLLKAYNMSTADLNGKAAAAANLKRKADWEQELEVRLYYIILHVIILWGSGVAFLSLVCWFTQFISQTDLCCVCI